MRSLVNQALRRKRAARAGKKFSHKPKRRPFKQKNNSYNHGNTFDRRAKPQVNTRANSGDSGSVPGPTSTTPAIEINLDEDYYRQVPNIITKLLFKLGLENVNLPIFKKW